MTFDEFYNRSGDYKHFKSHEWLVKGTAHSNRQSAAFGLNTDPPYELWEAAIPLWKAVDQLRKYAGTRIIISSAYRSPRYNKAIGGSKRSFHMAFLAADLIPVDITPKELHDKVLEFRRKGNFKGGVGKYKSFVHVDVRGTNVNW
jgi:hypothetical protein